MLSIFYGRWHNLVIKSLELNAGVGIVFTAGEKYFENSIVNCATLRIPSEYLAIDGMLHAYQGIVSPQEMVLHIKTYQTALSHTLILFAS